MFRYALYKVTGDPLLSYERDEYERMKDIYQTEYVPLSHREFKKFKRYWEINDKYNTK